MAASAAAVTGWLAAAVALPVVRDWTWAAALGWIRGVTPWLDGSRAITSFVIAGVTPPSRLAVSAADGSATRGCAAGLKPVRKPRWRCR